MYSPEEPVFQAMDYLILIFFVQREYTLTSYAQYHFLKTSLGFKSELQNEVSQFIIPGSLYLWTPHFATLVRIHPFGKCICTYAHTKAHLRPRNKLICHHIIHVAAPHWPTHVAVKASNQKMTPGQWLVTMTSTHVVTISTFVMATSGVPADFFCLKATPPH